MMKSGSTLCLLVTLLCAFGAHDVLGDDNSCVTYNFHGPNSINQCPWSGKCKHGKKSFKGTLKVKEFYLDENKQLVCDGEVTGSWGRKHKEHCQDYPVKQIPVQLEKCGNRRFHSPGGKCSDWCNAEPGCNSGLHCGEICKVPEYLGCTAVELTGDGSSQRKLLGNKRTCGHDKCDVIALFLGPFDVDVGCGCEIEFEEVEIIIGGYDQGILDELICLIGYLLDTGCDADWLVKLLNIWLGGCNSPSECGILSDVNASLGDIVKQMALPLPS